MKTIDQIKNRILFQFFKLLKNTRFWKSHYLIIRELKYFRWVVFLAIIFALLGAALEGLGVGFLLTFLQSLTEPNSNPSGIGVDWVDLGILGINDPPEKRIYKISFLILITTLFRAGFTYLGALFIDIGQLRLSYQLRLRIFGHLQSLPLSYFAKTRSGELINSITNEIGQVMQAVGVIATMSIKGSTLLVYVVSMTLLSWQLTLISVALFSLLTAGISVLLRQIREASFDNTLARGRYTTVAIEFINGIRTIQAFAAQQYERKRHYQANYRYLAASTKSVALRALIEPLAEGVATSIIICILLVTFSTLIPSGQLQVASLLTFLFILLHMLPIVKQLNGARARFSTFYGSFANIKHVLLSKSIPDLIDGHIRFQGFNRAIEFRSVDFGYDYEQLVLHNVTFTIYPGQTTAVVGASGAGKSTLIDLIPRFYDPTEGQILVDGIDLRQFNIESLRRNLAIVSQDTFIFNDTVRNNIAYALEDINEEEIYEVAQLANAWEFIQKLPHKFDTILGDRGVRLSGGQRQRIAIARALIHNPKILILDEATSALDSLSERIIQDSIKHLAKGRTVIAIAHRLSTILHADKVIFIENGQIVEQGGYQELLERRGKLWRYHQMQFELNQMKK